MNKEQEAAIRRLAIEALRAIVALGQSLIWILDEEEDDADRE